MSLRSDFIDENGEGPTESIRLAFNVGISQETQTMGQGSLVFEFAGRAQRDV